VYQSIATSYWLRNQRHAHLYWGLRALRIGNRRAG
jgi:hypothetical protein